MTTAQKKTAVQRLGAALLSFAMLLSLFWMTERPAKAADWMEPYLDQVVEWGVMRGDATGNLNADRQITRAEFVTLINRAFGYTEAGPNPFTDVLESDWFAEDIAIAHQAGYFNGTSPTTAAPYNLVTREQAAALLGRSLRLQGTTGSASSFTDGNEIGTWSRGLVQQAADMGIIQGYPDGSFRPDALITRGQVACFLVRALGTLVNEPGEQTSGGVYGNLTINTAGVKLKDTTITGNLYLTGGVGLGNVELENVTVLGEIVLCGAGEAERGENSVVLRNVTADSMVIDSLTDQFLSVRAEGLTDIGNTTVRTGSYLEDVTDDGLGLKVITLDGASGTQLQVAGNIKEIVNLTPNSNLQIAQGVAGTVTMDEKATGGRLNIDGSASIRDLNLDTATPVTGTGSISHVNVNAAGSNIAILPDTIYVRPGINSNINRTDMDTTAAAESSEDPRLLSGYPFINNVAPTSAQAIFSTNKAGTIYWVLSTLTDGSMGENELLNPSAYASRILRSGTISAAASKTEYTARLTGLTRDGSYYVSAMLVDNRGRHSPVKVAAFTTPDDTTPAFASGYPTTIMTEDEDGEQVVQVMTMPTKDCQMYYALLPNNAAAPSTADLKAGAVTGNLGYGVVDVKKNTPLLVPKVNTSYLQEQTTYNLYLWLNDADNGKSSAIRRLQVTTLDKTPPTITHLTHVESAARSATFTVALDEPGTLYWAVVKEGRNNFYASIPDGTENGRYPDPEELVAKIQIENGTNAIRSGRVNVARAATDIRFNVTGLEGQTRYHLYYVAKDRAGNYNVYTDNLTPPLSFSTLDNEPPTVTQEFTHDGTEEGQRNPTPYPDTDIRLVFSETVQGIQYINGQPDIKNFLSLYQKVESSVGEDKVAAQNALGSALHRHIKLHYRPASGQPAEVAVRDESNEATIGTDWVIDFRKATVELDPEGTGELIVTFPYNKSNPEAGGLKLGSGETYYFTLEGIHDTSQAANQMKGTRGVVTLPNFTTINAQLVFSQGSASGNIGGQDMVFDMNFRLTPVTTENVSNDTLWDMLFFSETPMSFDLYSRDVGGTWAKMGSASFTITGQHTTDGLSITAAMLTSGNDTTYQFEQLNQFRGNDREYGIKVTSVNGSENPGTWTGSASITIIPVAGNRGSMNVLADLPLDPERYAEHQKGLYAVDEIGVPTTYTVTKPFRDTAAPTFIDGYPRFTPSDTGVNMDIMLSRAGQYYYVIAPAGYIPTTINDLYDGHGQFSVTPESGWNYLPKDGKNFDGSKVPDVVGNADLPDSNTISNPRFSGSDYQFKSGKTDGAYMQLPVTGLLADTDYVAYFVLQGESTASISRVYAFGFHTEVISRPVLRAQINNPSASVESLASTTVASDVPKDAIVSYMVINSLQMGDYLNEPMSSYWDSSFAKTAGLSDKQIEAANSTYGKLTLVEAMATQYTANNRRYGSVFDLFTSADIQERIASWFETAQTSGTTILKVGIESENLTSRNKWISTVNCRTELSGKSGQYWFVAIGRSPLGSAYAFTAARYLSDPTVTHPMITAINFEYDRNESPSQATMAEAANQSYSGILTITFDGPLYFADNGVLKQVVDTSSTSVGTSGNYVKSSLICTLPQGIELVPAESGDSTATCESLSFRITQKFRGAAINFSQYLSNSLGQFGERGLSLSLDIVRETTGMYGADFVIDTEGWDARR